MIQDDAPLSITESVERFLTWTESSKHDLLQCRQILLSLMTEVPNSIGNPISDPPDLEYRRLSLEAWRQTYARFSDLPISLYQTILHPITAEIGTSATTGDLADDLADIYGELWHGWQAHLAGDKAYALNHWRESYAQHWGHHAAPALQAIDQFYRDQQKPF